MTRPVKHNQFGRHAAVSMRRGAVAALDIGTNKVACLIAETVEDNAPSRMMRVTGFGHQISEGLQAGQITDMRAAEDSLRAAVDAAERMAGVEVRGIIIGVSANRISSQICEARVPLHGQAVNADHMGLALRHACEKFWSEDHEILHAIPVAYYVDDSAVISDPRGMYGQNLRVTLHLISAPVGPIRNLLACVEQCHLVCDKLVVTPYASALSTLMQDEIDLGTLHIDMGGGTTSFTIFYEGAPVHAGVVPVGGHHITTDIARGLNVALPIAERIKTLYGSALASSDSEREQFELPANDGVAQMLPRSDLTKIIRPRLEETFEVIEARVASSGMAHLAGRRVVLTGGASQLSGVPELAQTILDRQPRLGFPMRLSGLPEAAAGPSFAACAGLLNYAGRQHADAALVSENAGGPFSRLAAWLRRNF